jgi:hypothetical protein
LLSRVAYSSINSDSKMRDLTLFLAMMDSAL